MNIKAIYTLALEMGIAADPRGPQAVRQALVERQSEYEALSPQAKSNWDPELLHNPFADTRILYGLPEQPLAKVFVGIDIGVSELLLVDRLNAKGAGIDGVIVHHPEGIALNTLYQVMAIQADVFACCGVPINAAEKILDIEATNLIPSLVVSNYNRVVDAARLLDLPLLCVHTPIDNLVQHHVEQLFQREQPATVQDILDVLMTQPEYSEATKFAAGPTLLAGSPRHRVGKIMVDMTGGSDAGPKLYEKLGQAGVGTVVAMHMSAGVCEKLQEQHINVILAGHMSSDSLGTNLFCDALAANQVKIVAGAGFTRFTRNQ